MVWLLYRYSVKHTKRVSILFLKDDVVINLIRYFKFYIMHCISYYLEIIMPDLYR